MYRLSYMLIYYGYRDAGVTVKNVEVKTGDIIVNLNDKMFLKNKSSSDTSSHADEANIDSTTTKIPKKKQSPDVAIMKMTSLFPEKVHGLSKLAWNQFSKINLCVCFKSYF